MCKCWLLAAGCWLRRIVCSTCSQAPGHGSRRLCLPGLGACLHGTHARLAHGGHRSFFFLLEATQALGWPPSGDGIRCVLTASPSCTPLALASRSGFTSAAPSFDVHEASLALIEIDTVTSPSSWCYPHRPRARCRRRICTWQQRVERSPSPVDRGVSLIYWGRGVPLSRGQVAQQRHCSSRRTRHPRLQRDCLPFLSPPPLR